MTNAQQPIGELKNIGPKMEAWLAEMQVHTRGDLEQLGAVMAYKMLQHQRRGVTVLALYALHGALGNRHWNSFSPDEKARLRAEAGGTLHVG